jgi:hypothetical protein
MGIELDSESTLLVDFQPGSPELEQDPLGAALLWYVDIRCRGRDLPSDAEGARRWFLENLEILQQGLEELAEEVSAGTDDDAPILLTKPSRGSEDDEGGDLVVQYACTSVRRVRGRELADVVLDLARHLRDYLNQLSAVVPLVR